ncbi:hypothetical protein CK203_108559 [Vitis vinifera]|uniref:Uncharacterized protein n=1 Tax=Vitis vinifera TaxID=29760 RepID=A0A438FFK3_VITVI|nr:hypothetical protein CK203_108559 [Vitis vinifera]
MLTQPPIEGNLDCRARPFHSELCFDIATFQLRPELAFIPPAAKIPHGALLTPRDFFYPALDSKERSLWRPFKISEGYFFPHHLIMAALLYFEEKVHKKKLQRADAIPLLFPRLLCQILEHLGVDQPERPQPAARRASPRHIPEGIPIAAPAIPRAPPVTPASSQPSTSAEPRMAIPISEYRELCRSLETLTASQSSLAHEMAAIRACQEQMLATQAQHTAILRQLQHHFDLPPAADPPPLPQQCHTLIPQSLRPHLEQLLKRQTHLPSPSTTHSSDHIYISIAYVFYEVPLPPFNCNHPYHIEDNAQFGWGEK